MYSSLVRRMHRVADTAVSAPLTPSELYGAPHRPSLEGENEGRSG